MPYLSTYNELSVDGRLGGFPGDPADFYRRAFRWPTDAILMGSVTALNFGPGESPHEQSIVLRPPAVQAPPAGFERLLTGERSLLLVPDSTGRVRNWRHARAQPWYRSIVVLIAESTPEEYVDYLGRRGIAWLRVGRDRVDLDAALVRVGAEFGVRRIRTDAGAGLNTALLRSGLVDEIIVLVRPALSTDAGARRLFELETVSERYRSLRLVESEAARDGSVLLRYRAKAG